MADDVAPKRRGRPRKAQSERVLTAELRVLMTPDMKEWTLDHGGSEMVRGLIQAARERQEAATQRADG